MAYRFTVGYFFNFSSFGRPNLANLPKHIKFMETNPKKETVNEKANPAELKHVAAGTPVPSGLKNEKKHEDDSQKSTEQLDYEAAKEFEKHNMNDKDGYNEMPNDVPIVGKNIADEAERGPAERGPKENTSD